MDFQLDVCSKRSCIFMYAVCVPMHWAVWASDSSFCCACPQPHWMKSQIPNPEFWWKVRSGIPSHLAMALLSSTGHLLGHSFFHSEETASSTWLFSMAADFSFPNCFFLFPNCSSQAFRFFLLLHLFFKPFFFLWYIISTHLTGECTQDIGKSCFKTTWW